MSIEDKLDKLSEESYRFHGEVRESLGNLSKYIGAVAANQKETAKDLKTHSESTGAHGLELREKGSERWVGWLALAVTSAVAAVDIFRHR